MSQAEPTVTIVVNGHPLSVPRGTRLLDAVRGAGIPLPGLCHHPALAPYGACRLCLVSLRRPRRGLVVSCTLTVEEGMVLETHDPEAVGARRIGLQVLLARYPGVRLLQDMALAEGVPPTDLASLVAGDPAERCILCGRCVRVCREVIGAEAIVFTGRGVKRRVTTPFSRHAEACIGCGACASVCPTGAISLEDVDGIRRIRPFETQIRLLPCRACGRPFSPEPLAFLPSRIPESGKAWSLCPSCRQKESAAALLP